MKTLRAIGQWSLVFTLIGLFIPVLLLYIAGDSISQWIIKGFNTADECLNGK
jgi:hypothetical protein